MTIEEMEIIEEMFFLKNVEETKNLFFRSKRWKCCTSEHCLGNSKVAARHGFVHKKAKNKLNK
jgi:hypothetical protein